MLAIFEVKNIQKNTTGMNKKSSNAIRAQNRLYFILIDFIFTKVIRKKRRYIDILFGVYSVWIKKKLNI